MVASSSVVPAAPKLSSQPLLSALRVWTGTVEIEPYRAYRLSWSTNLRDWQAGPVEWRQLVPGEELSRASTYSETLQPFFKVDYFDAFAPDIVGEEVLDLSVAELEEEGVELSFRGENYFEGNFKEVEEGIEVTVFFSLRYERAGPNDARVYVDFGTVRLRELASGAIANVSIGELARASGEVLPLSFRGELDYTGIETGLARFFVRYTNQTEEDLGTEPF